MLLRIAGWVLVACGVAILATSAGATRYEYDALKRLTAVTYDNGTSVRYVYDAAGNVTRVVTNGRSTASLTSRTQGGGGESRFRFVFAGTAGEQVTIRLEGIPAEAGIGKFSSMTLVSRPALIAERVDDEGVDNAFRRWSRSALPVELVAKLPQTGRYIVTVGHASRERDYQGDFRLTLEASERTCKSLEAAK